MNEIYVVTLEVGEGQQIEVSVAGFTGTKSTAMLMSTKQFDAFNVAMKSDDRTPWCEMTDTVDLTPDDASKLIRPPETGTWHVVFSNSHAGYFIARSI